MRHSRFSRRRFLSYLPMVLCYVDQYFLYEIMPFPLITNDSALHIFSIQSTVSSISLRPSKDLLILIEIRQINYFEKTNKVT